MISRLIHILILSILILSYPLFTHADIPKVAKRINRTPAGVTLSAVHFVDSLLGHAVGEHGVILKTFDGGHNWVETFYPYNTNFNDIKFNSSGSTGFIVGDEGVVLKSNDFGASWNKVTVPTNKKLNACYFYNSNEGLIVGDGATILRTTNGGQSWTVPFFTPLGETYTDIDIDGNFGIITTWNGNCLKTYSRGQVWLSFATNSNYNPGYHYTTKVLGLDTFLIAWYSLSGESLNISYDGGSSFSLYSSQINTSFINCIDADKNGSVYFSNSLISYVRIHQNNSNYSWAQPRAQAINNFTVINPNKSIAVGDFGQIYLADSNLNLSQISKGSLNTSDYCHWINDTVAYSLSDSFNVQNSDEYIVRSIDGTKTWTDSFNVNIDNYSGTGFYVIDDTTFTIATRLGIYRTTNFGLSFDTILQTDNSVKSFFAIGKDTLIYSGYGNSNFNYPAFIKISFDGGLTWQDRTPSNIPTFIMGVNKVGDLLYFISGNVGNQFYYSHDLGQTWSISNLPNSVLGPYIYFANDKIGYIRYSISTVPEVIGYFKTFDGGITWSVDNNLNFDDFMKNIHPDSINSEVAYKIQYRYNRIPIRELYKHDSTIGAVHYWSAIKNYVSRVYDYDFKPNGNLHIRTLNGMSFEYTNISPSVNSYGPLTDTGASVVTVYGKNLDVVKSARIDNDFLNISFKEADSLMIRIPSGKEGNIYIMTEIDTILLGSFTSINSLEEQDLISEEQTVSIYPNPANDVIYLNLREELSQNSEFIIYNIDGRLIKRYKINRNKLNIVVNNLLPGIYLFELRNSMVSKRGKFIKK